MPRRSGRYPWGSGDRPYQSGTKSNKKEFGTVNKEEYTTKSGDTGYKYSLKDGNGKIASQVVCYDYNMRNFDWVLMADVETNPAHRGKGLATDLINKAYKDISKKNKGMYLFVKEDNTNAINLYKKLNFETLKAYELDDGGYYIMLKGKANKSQFKNMNFS